MDYSALWFGLGALSFFFLSRIIGYISIFKVIANTNKRILVLAKIFVDNMSQNGYDRQQIVEWREGIIVAIHEAYPEHFHKIIPFINWNEAMKWLEKERTAQ